MARGKRKHGGLSRRCEKCENWAPGGRGGLELGAGRSGEVKLREQEEKTMRTVHEKWGEQEVMTSHRNRRHGED